MLDYVPTNKYLLFGHHFAAIARARRTARPTVHETPFEPMPAGGAH
jgi:hypothetical protein